MYMEKVLQELFWAHFFGHSYRSNGTKIYLDTALILATGIISTLPVSIPDEEKILTKILTKVNFKLNTTF